MNQQLAAQVAKVIIDKWNPDTHDLDSGDVYQELIARGIEVPDYHMNEILETFKNSGLINGAGYINSDAVRQDGAMVITSVNLRLLRQVEVD